MRNSIQQFKHLYIHLKTFIPKCFRRTVWETQHSGATGWELLSHFSDVWCSSLLQLTRSSNWQLESSFRCQISPQRMYVYDLCMYVCIVYVCTYVRKYMYVHTFVCMYVFICPSHPREHKPHTIRFLITDYKSNPERNKERLIILEILRKNSYTNVIIFTLSYQKITPEQKNEAVNYLNFTYIGKA